MRRHELRKAHKSDNTLRFTMITILNRQPWEYLDLLNECIRIMLTVGLGMAYSRIFPAGTGGLVPLAVRFVFFVTLPCTVLRGLGIAIDFYTEKNIWSFILAFLVLRVVALVISFLWILRGDQRRGIGDLAVQWLSMTWISTIILGIPIAKAVFGSEQIGSKYGILAAISSFILQLPLQLLFLECHKEEQESLCNNIDKEEAKEVAMEKALDQEEEESGPSFRNWLQLARDRDIWKSVVQKVFQNPVLWSIFGGFALSLSTVGPNYLKPGGDDYVPGLGWIFTTLGWVGDMTSPLSLFTMGLWMRTQREQLVKVSLVSISIAMLSKLVLVPLLMVGLAKWFDLDDVAGRAAILIAALPISMASFSLASNYNIGEAFLSANVCVGTALMLPTILIWNLVMDEVDLYPIAK